MQYLENKAALNKALERLNWPISFKELSILENEILAGKMYIKQAVELQEAAKKETYVSKTLEEVGAGEGLTLLPPSCAKALPALPWPSCLPTPTTLTSRRVRAKPVLVSGLLSNRKQMSFDFTLPYFLNNTSFN